MKNYQKFLAAGALALGLSGCATTQKQYQTNSAPDLAFVHGYVIGERRRPHYIEVMIKNVRLTDDALNNRKIILFSDSDFNLDNIDNEINVGYEIFVIVQEIKNNRDLFKADSLYEVYEVNKK